MRRRLKPGGGDAGSALSDAKSKIGDRIGGAVGHKVKDTVGQKVDEAGGAGGIAKQAAGGLLPSLGGDDGGGGSMDGVGKNRRMPVQQSMDVAVPIETAYNQFTQFEDWTEFMHRVTRVTQEDETNVSFAAKIWTRTREFKAEIITQRPDERIKWRVSEGITHTGVVTFHELAPRLTRIELNMDVEPGGMIEKAARGMRHIKRAARADLHRFKAYIEMEEQETGAWRGVIEDGELVEDHDPSYDEERESSEAQAGSDEESAPAEPEAEGEEGEEPEPEAEEEPEDEAQEAEEEPEAEAEGGDGPEASEEEAVEEEVAQDSRRQRTPRFQRQARTSSSGRGRSRGSNSGGDGRPRGRQQRSAGRR